MLLGFSRTSVYQAYISYDKANNPHDDIQDKDKTHDVNQPEPG